MQKKTTNRFCERIILPSSRKTNSTKTDITSENTSGYDIPNKLSEKQTPQHQNPHNYCRVEPQMHHHSKIFKLMEQNATTLCIEEQHELLHQAKIEGDEPTIKARQKPNAEKTARVYQKLWNIRGTMAAGITQLQVP